MSHFVPLAKGPLLYNYPTTLLPVHYQYSYLRFTVKRNVSINRLEDSKRNSIDLLYVSTSIVRMFVVSSASDA